ncbi:MAG: helix-hairpin-helix domain-containing protein [Planctomycetes bacterium]|nr:helix-hairpin-helix domain-containing protein [Planctomycetota bacterium]
MTALCAKASGRGVVLIAVLVVLTIGALVGTTVLAMTSAERATAETSLRRTQARALVWSGVQAVMAELATQREDILQGRDPHVTEEWTVFERQDGTRGVFRLIPIGADGLPIVSESAKLDVNHATAEMLEALPMIDRTLADAIVQAREQRLFRSVEELIAVDGIDADLLYGQPGAFAGEDALMQGGDRPALTEVLTVFSFDPNIQAGIGREGYRHRGDLRINLNTPWSERLGRAIARRYDDNVANVVKGLKERGVEFESKATLVEVLSDFNVPPRDWAEVFDVFTVSSDPYLLGRVDVTQASEMVLACLPGFDDAIARSAVEMRDGLDAESLKSPTWLVAEEVLTPVQYAQCADTVTTRSMQWRVRIEAGLLRDDAQINWSGGDRGNPAEADFESLAYLYQEDAGLMDRVVVEAVIDISSARPRVAYLRDLTLMNVGWAIRDEIVEAQLWEQQPDDRTARDDTPDEELESAQDPAELTIGGSIQRGARPGSDSGVGQRAILSCNGPERKVGAAPGVSADENEDATGREQDMPEAGPDRRLGRWTTGQGVGR